MVEFFPQLHRVVESPLWRNVLKESGVLGLVGSTIRMIPHHPRGSLGRSGGEKCTGHLTGPTMLRLQGLATLGSAAPSGVGWPEWRW